MIKVCIIGAGASGLRCASVLLEHGFAVTIFEARDRIGGRVAQSDEMGPMKVDIGANWVHSTGHNPILEIARKTGTEMHSWDPTSLIYDSQGKLVDPDRATRITNFTWKIIEDAIEYSRTKGSEIEKDTSLYDYFQEQCEAALQRGEMLQDDVHTVLGMAQMWGAYVGTRVERQSLKFFFLEDCIESDDYFIPENYEKIVQEIARKPLAEAEVHLNTKVTSVIASLSPANTPVVEVRTTGADAEAFDAVVVTSSLGWLKQNASIINPIKSRIQNAINAISVGNLEKVLIEFPVPFWQTPGQHPPSFVHWMTPDYALDTSPHAWRLECVSFSVFPDAYRRNILLFYTYGECSLHITSSIKGTTGTKRHEILRRFFEPYYSRLPNWDATTCTPLRFLATEWSNDELSGYGSYSNFQVGIERADDHVRTLRHGMPEHNIYFAGEHTAPFDGLGTVAGAYNSGQRVAERLIEKHIHGKSIT